MKINGVIPARWGSTRFPGKAIAIIAGKPMIQRVIERAVQAKSLNSVIVATDDQRIVNIVEKIDIPNLFVSLTRPDHPSGTDRIAEIIDDYPADIYVNIQGDEPLIEPELIDLISEPLTKNQWHMSTAVTPLDKLNDINNPSIVKAIFDSNNKALYFSRHPIPYIREDESDCLKETYWRHIGIYGYKKEFLKKLVQTPPCLIENAEKLEQLRALHIGGHIRIIKTNDYGIGVDTPKDLSKVEKIIEERNLV